MVDIHSHILPEIDDGARTWEMALQMCQMAERDGITHMVASPHANDEFVYERQRFQQMLHQLHDLSGKKLKFSLGCDFHFSYDNLAELEKDPTQFTIAGTDYLLVELSDFSIPPWVTQKLEDLLIMGLHPIITHPERNMLLQKHPEQVNDWARMGCPVQVTANSITGGWGPKASKAAQWLLQKESVHVVASDCHNVEGRPPILSKAFTALENAYGLEIANALTTDNPLAVVENRELPYFP